MESYQRLVDEGLLSARPGVGTVVMPVRAPPEATNQPAEASADRSAGVPRLPVPASYWPKLIEFDLSPGIPDLAMFPRAAWLRAERAVLRSVTSSDLGYGDPRGSARLRDVLAGWLASTRGVHAAPDDILIVAGVAQSLALLAQSLTSSGQTAIGVEDPGSRGVRDHLAHWGLQSVPVAVDQHGINVDELEMTGLSTTLITPAHQFPTGVVLSPARRRELLEWAQRSRLVIEDDYDAEHRYDRGPVRALQPLAREHIAYTGSTSKTLAPGLRLGWLVPPPRLHADLVAARHASDLGSPALPQLVLAHFISSGDYARHLRLVRTRQRQRRDAVLSALAEYMPNARVEGVAAGLHLLITLPELDGHVDDVELAADVRECGVVVHPLSWHRQRPGSPGLIVGYAAQPPDRLREAVRRMSQPLNPQRLKSRPIVPAARPRKALPVDGR